MKMACAILLAVLAFSAGMAPAAGPSFFPVQLDSGENGGWRGLADTATGLLLQGEKGVLFYGYDTLGHPNDSIELAVRIQSVQNELQGVAGLTVEFTNGKNVIGSAVTDDEGWARLNWKLPREGVYQVTARITAAAAPELAELLTLTPAQVVAASWPKDKPLVFIDLDHTVVDASFWRVLAGGAEPMLGSVAATRHIAQKYGIVYLTQRPDLMTLKSKSWLQANGYPLGPLLLSPLRETSDGGKFKSEKLEQVKKMFPQVAIGIGDRAVDAQAYLNNGMTAYLIPNYKRTSEKDLRRRAFEIRSLGNDQRLNVVDTWRQIEQGIFEGRHFPGEAYAQGLQDQADRIAMEKRTKDRHKDDDDD